MLVKPTISMIPHRQIMENVGFTNIPSTFLERNFGNKKTVNIKLGSLKSHSKRNLAFPETHNYQGTQTNIREHASDLNRTRPGYRGGTIYIYTYIYIYTCVYI